MVIGLFVDNVSNTEILCGYDKNCMFIQSKRCEKC